jgi:hypothetical protein
MARPPRVQRLKTGSRAVFTQPPLPSAEQLIRKVVFPNQLLPRQRR